MLDVCSTAKKFSDMRLFNKNVIVKQAKIKSMVNVLEFKNRAEKVDLAFNDH